MSSFVEVSKTSELKDGTIKEISAQGRQILLARVSDKYYAADTWCTHMGGRLSQGKLEGTVVVTCPLHGSQFDLKSGEVVRWLKGSGIAAAVGKALKPPRRLTVYNVKVEDDRVMIEI